MIDASAAVHRAVLALGSNLGDRLAALQGAVDALADTPEVWVRAVSPVYETEPVDCPPEATTFLNAVVQVDTSLAPAQLLARAHAIEASFARQRRGIVNAPRTLDVDVIVVGEERSDEDALRLPHPRARDRAFVLCPWHDVDADAVLPGAGPIAQLRQRADQTGVARRDDLVLTIP